jgi:tetratricopeptide (TPR) repeat protein
MQLVSSIPRQIVLLFVVCFVAYGNTIGNDYAYDDAVVITENAFTKQGIAGIPDIFKRNTFAGSYEGVPLLERYRPLSLATFAVERTLLGANPHVGHFINVVLFATAVCLLLAFLRRLLAHREDTETPGRVAFVAALLFAVHPVHTEIVANIKGRDEILVLAGALSSMLFILKYLDQRRRRHLVLAFLCFAIAMFAKENALTFLAVVPLTVFTYRKGKAKDHLAALAPIVLASVVYLVVRGMVLKGAGGATTGDVLTDPFALASTGQRFATIVYSLGAYLRLLVFPHPLTTDYQPFHIALMNWGNLTVWLSLVAHLALLAYALVGLTKRSLYSYGILFYLVTLSMVSNLPFSTGTFMSERFIFVPSVGFALVLSCLLTSPWLARVLSAPRYANALVGMLVLAFTVKTIGRNAEWKDDLTLLTADAKTSSNSVKANMAAAVECLAAASRPGREAMAAELRTRALEYAKKAVLAHDQNVDPVRRKGSAYQSAMALLGNAYSENGLLPDALRFYRTLMGDTAQPEALQEMIQTAINKSDDVDFRLKSTLEFAALAPNSFTFNYHLGLLYGKDKGDIPTSITYFKKAVDIAPDDANALRGLGHAHYLAGEFPEAVRCFQKLSDRAPSNLSLLRTLFELYRRMGNAEKQGKIMERMQAVSR